MPRWIIVIRLRIVLDEFFENLANDFNREVGDIEALYWGY
jgi:hypothetical protein